MNRIRFEGFDYAATADFELLRAAYDAAGMRGPAVTVGQMFSSDSFYSDRPELLMRMVEYGVVAVEMESNALYTLAAKHGRRALAVCTVSDHVVKGEEHVASGARADVRRHGRDRPGRDARHSALLATRLASAVACCAVLAYDQGPQKTQ